jgi:mannose-6-phosphate isomerase-like protein (cupin superfamily)
MNGFVQNIESLSLKNNDFRRVIYTTERSQLVLMMLQPHEEIGMEMHEDIDQFFRVEEGKGEAILNEVHHKLEDGSAVLVPAGVHHNIVNTGDRPLKLYTLYTPPNHRDGVVHHTRAEAEADKKDDFDGVTTK